MGPKNADVETKHQSFSYIGKHMMCLDASGHYIRVLYAMNIKRNESRIKSTDIRAQYVQKCNWRYSGSCVSFKEIKCQMY